MKHLWIAVVSFLLLGLGAPLAFAEPASAKGSPRARQGTPAPRTAGAAKVETIRGGKSENVGRAGKEKDRAADAHIGVGEHAAKESGEKGGTADINIGVGELYE